jgi:hypothetical protein
MAAKKNALTRWQLQTHHITNQLHRGYSSACMVIHSGPDKTMDWDGWICAQIR